MATAVKTEELMLPPPPPTIRLSHGEESQDTNEKVEVKTEQSGCNYDNDVPQYGYHSKSQDIIDLEYQDDSDTVYFASEDCDDAPEYRYSSGDDIFCPPAPASSVFELPVPVKPPPELVDLLDDDVVEEDPIEQTAEELITLHTSYYPGNPLPKLVEVEKICGTLVAEYKVKGVQAPPRKGSPQVKTMVTNYLRHMVQNQKVMNRCLSKLTEDSKSDAIAETVWKKWSARTNLNDHMDAVIRCKYSDPAEVKTAMSDPKKHWREILPLLIDGKTQLQLIFTPKFSQPLPTAAIMNTDLIWKAQWSPLNLTLSYELFEKTMPTTRIFSSIGFTQGIRLMKKWYIEYMSYIAISEQEFLMAVISCFGTNVKFYPGRVLSIFRSKNMLVESFQNVQDEEMDSEVTVVSVNKQNSNPRTTNQDSQNAQSRKIVSPRTKTTFEKSQVSNTNRNIASPSQQQNQQAFPPGVQLISAADRARVKLIFGISCEQFEEILQRIYHDFTGTTAIPGRHHLLTPWLQRHGSALTSQNLNLLTRALSTLEEENKRHFSSDKSSHQIKKLEKFEITQWKKTVNPDKIKREVDSLRKNPALRSIAFTPQTTMECGMSLLQLSLIQTGTSAHDIPPRNGWSPLNCAFPFDLFKTLFKKKLQFKLLTLTPLQPRVDPKVYEDAVKVRYVEFLWKLFDKNVRQLLIGIFSAIGPDPDDLPLRILHILQLTGLWRGDLGLPLCSAVNTKNEVFKPLSQNFRKRKLGNQIPVTPIPAKMAKSNPPPPKVTKPPPGNKKNANLEPIGGRRATPGRFCGQAVWQNAPPPPPPPPPQRPPPLFPSRSLEFTNGDWTRLTRTALEAFELPELSGSGCLETYQRYTHYSQTPHGREDTDFFKGVLAGISLALKSNEERTTRNEPVVVNNYLTTAQPPQPDQLTQNGLALALAQYTQAYYSGLPTATLPHAGLQQIPQPQSTAQYFQ